MPLNETEEYILSLFRPFLGDKAFFGDVNVKIQAGEVSNAYAGRNFKPPKTKHGSRKKG